jgi:hypothetical protein
MKRTTLTFSFFATLGTFGVLSGLAFLAACAPLQSASSGTSDSASRDPSSTQSTATRPLAYCNHTATSLVNLNIQTYTDSSGTRRNDIIQAKLQSMTENFKNGSDNIHFFRWKADSSGAVYVDPTPIQLTVIAESTGQTVSSSQPFLRWDMVSSFATTHNIAGSASDFFTRVRLILDIRDPNAEYNALTMVYSDASGNTLARTDILIPVFPANPNDYAIDSTGANRAPVLRGLHPFTAATGLTANAYQTQANAFCFGTN